MSSDELLTAEQVATKLQLSVRTIREWLNDGRLPGIRIGRVWRVDPKDLERFIEEQRGKELVASQVGAR